MHVCGKARLGQTVSAVKLRAEAAVERVRMRQYERFARHNELVVFASSGNASECRMCVADKRLGAMSHAQRGDSVKKWRYLFRVRMYAF